MAKKLNKNVVVSLALFVFVMAIVLAVLMFRQLQQRDPKHFVVLAEQYAARAEWRTAALFYKKAWDRGHDATYLVSMGDALLNDGEVGRALQSLDQALINQPDLVAGHVRKLDLSMELARFYGTSDDWTHVRETAEAFLASPGSISQEEQASAHHARGLALVRPVVASEEELQAGEEELRKAVELAPDQVTYALALFEFLVNRQRAGEGERLLADLVQRYDQPGGSGAKVRLASAKYMASKMQWAEAEGEFTKSLAYAQADKAALRETKLGLAMFLAQQWARAVRDDPQSTAAETRFEAAERQLKECIEADADDYDSYLQLATLYGAARRFEDVVRTCDVRLGRGLVRKGLAGPRNRINTFNLMLQGSKACVEAAEAARVAGDDAERQRWLTKADQYVASAQGEYPDRPPVLSQAGRVKLARGLERQALEDFRRADEAYRSHGVVDWENKYLLASTHLRLNEAGAAKLVLEEVLADPKRPRAADPGLLLLYAQTLFKTDELDRALAIAEQLLVGDANNAEARRIKAAVLERQGRPADAARLVGGELGDGAIAAILNSREKALNGDTEGAIAILRSAADKAPANVQILSALVRQLLASGAKPEARQVIDRAIQAAPDSLQLRALAVLTQENLTDEDRDRQMLDIIRQQDDGYQRALEMIDFHVRRRNWSDLLPIIDEALMHLGAKDTPAARNATVAQHRALLASKLGIAAELHDEGAMASARDEGAASDVDGAKGKSLLGLYHMHRKEYDLAIKAFTEATDAQPTDARSLAYLGQCLQIAGRTDDAEATYERAVGVNPDEGQAHRGLASLALARGDTAAFEKSLAVCQRLIPDDPWVASQTLAKKEEGNPGEAITRRRAELEQKPDDPVNLYRLATLSEKVGDLDQADGYYARLLALQPDNKDLVVATGRYFRRTNRPSRSLEVITQYAQTRTTAEDRANAQILLASHYLSQNDGKQVEQALLDGAKIAETFDVAQSLVEYYLQQARRPDLARPWLDKAIALGRSSASPRLPQLMATRVSCVLNRQVNDVDAARKYIDELLLAYPNYPAALLLQGDLRARLGEIDRALESLTEYLRQKPGDAFGLFQRALHYWSQGRLERAVEDLSAIKRKTPYAFNLEPRFLLAMLQRQSGRKDLWIDELEALVRDAPDSSRAIEELTRAYAGERRLEEAERLATTRINTSADKPQARWYFLRSRIALELGDAAKAFADAQRGAEIEGHSPESVLGVLAVSLRVARPAEGVEYYRRYAPAKPTSSALVSAYALLLAKAGRTEESVAEFHSAMGLAVSDSPAARGRVLSDLRAAFPTDDVLAKAIELLSQPGADGVSNRVSDRLLAGIDQMAARHDPAAERLKRLIDTASTDQERSDLCQDLGDVYQGAGRMDDARRAFEEALKYNPDNWLTLNNFAYLLSDHFGENDRAKGYAQRAVALADIAPTLDTLGWIFVGLGEFRLAVAELSRAVRLAPGDPLSYFHLGEAYRRLGEFEVAGSVLRGGIELARTQAQDDLTAKFEASLGRVAAADRGP